MDKIIAVNRQLPLEVYSNERIAEFLLNNSMPGDDYERARARVRELGVDPDAIAPAGPAPRTETPAPRTEPIPEVKEKAGLGLIAALVDIPIIGFIFFGKKKK
jgi:hypothetical protein